LAGGSARVILNEVVSSDPSLLNGYVEVAGTRAEVVIANPAGISCSGCGFINAQRATLTTGTPQLRSGALEGYRVAGGTIRVAGTGHPDVQPWPYVGTAFLAGGSLVFHVFGEPA